MSASKTGRAWSWRHAVTKSDLQPTTRHVLLTLSVFMDGAGQSCFPSIEDLVAATGLTKRSILTHIGKACAGGWLRRKPHGFRGQKWKRQEYEPGWPGRETDSDPGPETAPEGGAPRSPPSREVVNVVPEGGEPPSPKAVNDVYQDKEQSNHQSITSPLAAEDARARKELVDGVRDALWEAGGSALSPISTGLIVLAEPLRWLENGCLLQEDILPVVRSLSARRRPNSIRGWGYFGPAVIEARDRRLAPVPEPKQVRGERHGARNRRPSTAAVRTAALADVVASRARERERQAGPDAGQGREARAIALDHGPPAAD